MLPGDVLHNLATLTVLILLVGAGGGVLWVMSRLMRVQSGEFPAWISRDRPRMGNRHLNSNSPLKRMQMRNRWR